VPESRGSGIGGYNPGIPKYAGGGMGYGGSGIGGAS